MCIAMNQLFACLNKDEGENLDFKEAKEQFDSKKLAQHCIALANEGGGRLILGVTDKKPRRVVGTKAFPNIEKTKLKLLDRLHLRIDMVSQR